MIMVILIAVLGLVVVNAMKHSPWATSTVAATMPIAMLVGIYMRISAPAAWSRAGPRRRPHAARGLWAGAGSRAGASGSYFVIDTPHAGDLDHRLRIPRVGAAGVAVARAARLPVRVHQARHHHRAGDRHRAMHPPAQMPALTQFVDGTGRSSAARCFPSLHHDRLRGDLGLPLADRVGHDAQDARRARRRAPGRLRRDAAGIVRRHHGDDRGGDARSGRLLRHQQSRRRGRRRRRGVREDSAPGGSR